MWRLLLTWLSFPHSFNAPAGRRLAGWPAPPLRRARRDPVGVEYRVDIAQARDRRVQRLRVGDLEHEAVAHHLVVDQAAGLEDVHALLGEGPREVLEQAVAVPRVDVELDLERGLAVGLPRHGGEPVGVLAQRDRVRAVLAMDGDAAAERDVADDRVAGHRAAALGQAQHHVVDALHADAVRPAGAGGLAALAARRDERLDGLLLVLGRLALLEALQDL